MARADMESANTKAPIAASGRREAAVRVIGVNRCGATRFAMMGDRSLGKAREEIFRDEAISGGECKARAGDFLFRPAHGFALRLAVAQRGVANACEFVGERAGGLVVVGTRLHAERPLA